MSGFANFIFVDNSGSVNPIKKIRLLYQGHTGNSWYTQISLKDLYTEI